MSVDVDVRQSALEVYYNRELRARFNLETGELLPLDDVEIVVSAAGGQRRN
jgi:hypothetical protein